VLETIQLLVLHNHAFASNSERGKSGIGPYRRRLLDNRLIFFAKLQGSGHPAWPLCAPNGSWNRTPVASHTSLAVCETGERQAAARTTCARYHDPAFAWVLYRPRRNHRGSSCSFPSKSSETTLSSIVSASRRLAGFGRVLALVCQRFKAWGMSEPRFTLGHCLRPHTCRATQLPPPLLGFELVKRRRAQAHAYGTHLLPSHSSFPVSLPSFPLIWAFGKSLLSHLFAPFNG